MGPARCLSAVLILGLLSDVRGWTAPKFCHDSDCPEFTVLNTNNDFEERAYVATQWITTWAKSDNVPDLISGFAKLSKYCKGHNAKGVSVSSNTEPALISIRKGVDGVFLSWFLAPGPEAPPTPTNTAVRLEKRAAGTVYVRAFRGRPTHDKALSNMETLRDDLTAAKKSFVCGNYTGAGYDNPLNIFAVPYNEVWFYGS